MPHVEIKTANRPDEWKIEQGMAGAVLPILDMTEPEVKRVPPQKFPSQRKKNDAAIRAVGDPKKLFTRERKGWRGYVLSLIYCS